MTTTTFSFDGRAHRAHQFGDGAGSLYVLPGFVPGCGQEWGRVLDGLGATHRVVVVDHPGFDGAQAPPWLRTVADLAVFHAHALHTLVGDRPVDVLGHSLGGWVALALCLQSPGSVRSLSLVAPMGLRDERRPPTDLFALDPAAVWSLPSAGGASAVGDPNGLDALRALSSLARIAWNPRLFDPSLAARLGWIEQPALVLWGGRDRVLPAGYAERYAALLRDARVRILPDGGHELQRDAPDEVLTAVSDFLGR